MFKRIIIGLIVLFFLAGCATEQPSQLTENNKQEVSMLAKALFVVPPEDFQPVEYSTTRKILEQGKVKVVTASLKKEATGKTGEKITVDFLLKDATSDYDVVVFIGGPGAEVYFDNEKALGLAREFNDKGKVVAAICLAPSILANAGILDGKNATVFYTEQGTLEENGATYTGASVTVDGNIITGNGPGASEEFAKKILGRLK